MSSVFILLGAPGAGKGTQAKRLSKHLSLAHISTGDLFRENLANDTELGKRARSFMEAGKLVPDELVLEMLFDRVAQPDCKDGFLLDGFPRTLPQADALAARLTGKFDVKAVNFEVRDETIVERASGRLTCKDCGNIQHKTFQPPKVKGVCDVCGGELRRRDDDRPEVVKKRLAVYHEQTAPLVEYYESRDLLTRIDGERRPSEVFESTMDALTAKEAE